MRTFQTLARAIVARQNCLKSNNDEWKTKWEELISALLETFPHGSGFDNGTKIDLDRSGSNCLVFDTAFHHMNEDGMYVRWTSHCVIVHSDLAMGFTLKASGANYNQIKEYIAERFHYCLNKDSTPVEQEVQL